MAQRMIGMGIEHAQVMADGIARQKNNVLREETTKALGLLPGTPMNVLLGMRDRLSRLFVISTGVETFCLDGRPFLEFYPPTFNMDEETCVLTATQSYRRIT